MISFIRSAISLEVDNVSGNEITTEFDHSERNGFSG
nr:MAG TPA: hypothetical protein [Caudoviricetes sp.]DAS44992.1 MAG TPA: hypothetical protein [Caudoviricetes sp.]